MDSGSQTRLVIRTLQKLLKNQIPRPQPITAPDGKGQETARLKGLPRAPDNELARTSESPSMLQVKT